MLNYALANFADAGSAPLSLAVVIPTFNERDNIVPLLERLVIALAGIEWEAVFVDDSSTDGTPELIVQLAETNRAIRLVHRVGRRGLSSAVIEGMLASTAPILAVIDADLQHDEAILPMLFAAVRDGADLAIGTRYADKGSTGDWAAGRVRASRLATGLASLLLRMPVSDPMSGFFAIRRGAMMASLPRLSAMGYKILLDLVASAPRPLVIREVPYAFRNRVAGASKLDSAIAIEYALLLFDKLFGRWVPIRFAMFLCVGALGVVIHLGALGLLLKLSHLPFATAQTCAVITAMTFNFFLNNIVTYRDRRLTGVAMLRGLASFYLICGAGAAANIGVGELLYASDHRWWLAGAAGAAIGSVWNYAASSALTWRRK